MISIFAREITDDLAGLVKQVDKLVADNQDKKMAAFVVLLTDDPDAAAPKLEKLAAQHNIENVPLTTYNGTEGPSKYNLSKDAEVTVLMWRRTTVKANHAFADGELNDGAVRQIVADSDKILN